METNVVIKRRAIWSSTIAFMVLGFIGYIIPELRKLETLKLEKVNTSHLSLIGTAIITYIAIAVFACMVIRIFKELKPYKEKGLISGLIWIVIYTSPIMGICWIIITLICSIVYGPLLGFINGLIISSLMALLFNLVYGLVSGITHEFNLIE